MSDDQLRISRRNALKCMAYGGAGTLFALSGGVFTPIDLAMARGYDETKEGKTLGKPLFVQISDTHIGFNKEANPDVAGTLTQTIDIVNAMPVLPALIIHTGDITHLSKPAELDQAQQLFARLRATEMHTVPGEHDTTDATVTEYFNRFGKASNNKGYYSFDHAGVHFIALINVLEFKPGGLGTLGAEQLAWVAADLKGRSASTPIVVFAHMPLWTIYEPWGWGTGRGSAHEPVATLRFGHRAQWPHPSDCAEGRRQHRLPHGPLDLLSATCRRRGSGARPAQGPGGSIGSDAGDNQRLGSETPERTGAHRHGTRLARRRCLVRRN
jgi:hypothetical protein